jgi:hypothetical protein
LVSGQLSGGKRKIGSQANLAVAKIDARDMDELALKACLSAVYDAVHVTYPNTAMIGFSVALNLISLTVQS